MSSYTPDIRWLIDWDDDDYANTYCDVTDYVVDVRDTWGSAPHLDGRSVAVSHGLGELRLYNQDNRYNPNSSSALVPADTLRQTHKYKATVGSTLIRQGLCEFAGAETRIGGAITFRLKGKHSETITRGGRSFVSEGKTLSGVAQQFSSESGIALSVGSVQPTGHVVFEGSWLYFLQDLSAFGGGWALERSNGDYVFRRWSDSPNLPLVASLSAEYGHVESPLRFQGEEGHVRNSADCVALVWSAAESSIIAYSTVTMKSGEQKAVRLSMGDQQNVRPHTWSSFTLSDTTNFSFRMVNNAVEQATPSDDPAARVVYVIPGTFTGQKEVQITATGTVERRRRETSKSLKVTQGSTQDVFGDRPLLLPPWFPADYDGTETYTRPWLTNLSQPPVYLSIVYPERQETAGRWSNLNSAANPGNAVDVAVNVTGTLVTFEMLVLSVSLSGGRNRPYYRTIVGIQRKAVPEAPLTVSIDGIGDTEAFAEVGVPNPGATKTIYGRYRKKVPAAPAAPTVATGNSQELVVSWTAVRNASSYTVQWSTKSDFTASPSTATVSSGVTHTITKLTNGTTYYVRVSATNTTGTSSYGPSASGAPSA